MRSLHALGQTTLCGFLHSMSFTCSVLCDNIYHIKSSKGWISVKKFLKLLLVISLLFCSACSKTDMAGSTNSLDPDNSFLEDAMSDYQNALDELENLQNELNNPPPSQSAANVPVELAPSDNEYLHVSASQMFDDLEANAVKAEMDYVNKYVAVTGLIHYSGFDGFSIVATIDPFAHLYEDAGSIFCQVERSDKTFSEAFFDDNKNKEITVWGKVTSLSDEYNTYYIDVVKYELDPVPSLENIDFVPVNLEDLILDCREDFNIAQEKYLNQYITFTGIIDEINSDYFTVNAPHSDLQSSIRCYYTSDELKLLLVEKSVGDTITVSGLVTDLGYALFVNYDIDILALS